MNEDKAITMILLTFIFTAIIFYCLGVWHATKVNNQELKKFMEKDKIADERKEAYLWGIISRYVLLTDKQETIIRELQTKGYIETEDMDLLRSSRGDQ